LAPSVQLELNLTPAGRQPDVGRIVFSHMARPAERPALLSRLIEQDEPIEQDE
jgi:hypothetical protein